MVFNNSRLVMAFNSSRLSDPEYCRDYLYSACYALVKGTNDAASVRQFCDELPFLLSERFPNLVPYEDAILAGFSAACDDAEMSDYELDTSFYKSLFDEAVRYYSVKPRPPYIFPGIFAINSASWKALSAHNRERLATRQMVSNIPFSRAVPHAYDTALMTIAELGRKLTDALYKEALEDVTRGTRIGDPERYLLQSASWNSLTQYNQQRLALSLDKKELSGIVLKAMENRR